MAIYYDIPNKAQNAMQAIRESVSARNTDEYKEVLLIYLGGRRNLLKLVIDAEVGRDYSGHTVLHRARFDRARPETWEAQVSQLLDGVSALEDRMEKAIGVLFDIDGLGGPSSYIQTTWECTNPNCETRKKGLFVISSQPSYARVQCEECGAPMQIASSGPHTQVLFVGQMPGTVLSAGALPIRRAEQGFFGRLFGAPTQASIDDPDIASYPQMEAACRNPLTLHPDLYGWLQSSYLFLVRTGGSAATLIVVRCPSHHVPGEVVVSSPASVHVEAHSIKGYQVFGIYPLLWHGHPDFWNSETKERPYDMIGANEKEMTDAAQRYSWRKMFYLLTQADTKVLFIDERNKIIACKSATRYPTQPADYARLLGPLEMCFGKQIGKQDATNLTLEYNREVDIDAVRARVRPLR